MRQVSQSLIRQEEVELEMFITRMIREGWKPRVILDFIEEKYIRLALDICDFKIARAATQVGMDRSNFKRLMRKHGIEREAR